MQIELKTKQPNPHFGNVDDIAPNEVLEKSKDLFLVDVREPSEYTGELGHVEGSQLIVLSTLPENLAQVPKDKTVVFICRSGGRSAQATAYAKSQGFTTVYNMLGGMMLWNQLQLPTER